MNTVNITLKRGKYMIHVKYIISLLLIFCVLFPHVAMAAEEDDNVKVISADGNDITNKNKEVSDSSNSDDNGGLSADEIFSNNKVLGQDRGSGKLGDLFNVDNYIGTISAFDIVWAIVELVFALIGGLVLIMYPGTLLWNALKKIYASRGENADQVVTEIKKINQKDYSLTTGLGLTCCLIAGAMFIYSLL